MPLSMDALADDLAAETAELRATLGAMTPADWRRPTPARGWCIGDQVSHLAYFDDAAVQATTDPDGFLAELARWNAEGGVNPDTICARFRDLPGEALLAWFDEARTRLLTSFRRIDPAARVPWFGPSMSAASSLTARLMETWAHGQDIVDTLGLDRKPTDRLRHVAHLGVRARAFSYTANGRQALDLPVRVELTAPSGATWSWGPHDAADRVSGPALDFCLVVTQRRHPEDAALAITGRAAGEWMAIAQAFAGPPGAGRQRGQFR
ncbi:TIGR03084 family metal-binding protein [Candidatus Mycolicibacterium alkanivorans]|uniref:TIGR03084 family protein n=1 Tax=Candidatus Mycolicibacterium alkanivorans TaxID=2954114 RepID=A0ABS9YZ03_9MYCO|nr:TIGR03084 family metal-binding protein [Candidatus Mycolicibacterium alkanivorans]MCI4676491.1 TIGR03084 family protein [Candidatus Mycolicibacterium alkanivorans]